MEGVIEHLKDTYGFIRGNDRVSYFFIPTGIQQMSAVQFNDVKVGMRVRFTPIEHPKGPRAIEVDVLGGDRAAD